MPRPPKNEEARLSRKLAIRMTDAEFLELEELATSAGMRVSGLARLLIKKHRGRIVIEVAARMDPAYIAQIKRIGNNLNLLCKNAMIFKRISQVNWADACSVLGRNGAAICLLLTDQAMQRRDDPVRSPGAYFRSMITRVGSRELNLHAAIFAILKRESNNESIG